MNRDFQKIIVRQESSADFKKIDEITDKAFDKSGELVIELVHLIRKSSNYIPELALVAEIGGRVVGHIMLSHLNLDDNGNLHQVIILSPISVKPELQKRGIGTALIKEAIKKADTLHEPLIVLEGHPSYYPRFGFKLAKEFGVSIDLPHWAPKEAAMVYILSNYKANIKGKVVYPPAFAKVNEASRNRPDDYRNT